METLITEEMIEQARKGEEFIEQARKVFKNNIETDELEFKLALGRAIFNKSKFLFVRDLYSRKDIKELIDKYWDDIDVIIQVWLEEYQNYLKEQE